MKGKEVVVEYTFGERNQMTNFLSNHVFFFSGIEMLNFLNFQQLSSRDKVILNMDKDQV